MQKLHIKDVIYAIYWDGVVNKTIQWSDKDILSIIDKLPLSLLKEKGVGFFDAFSAWRADEIVYPDEIVDDDEKKKVYYHNYTIFTDRLCDFIARIEEYSDQFKFQKKTIS